MSMCAVFLLFRPTLLDMSRMYHKYREIKPVKSKTAALESFLYPGHRFSIRYTELNSGVCCLLQCRVLFLSHNSFWQSRWYCTILWQKSDETHNSMTEMMRCTILWKRAQWDAQFYNGEPMRKHSSMTANRWDVGPVSWNQWLWTARCCHLCNILKQPYRAGTGDA